MSLVMRKPVLPYANNKGADQPAHPRSLINTFIVRCLDSIIPLVSIHKISSLYLASVPAQAGLSLSWSQTPKTGFLVTRFNYNKLFSFFDYTNQHHVSPVKRIGVFEHSVMTNFNCACQAIQRGQGPVFLSEGSSWLTASMSEQRRFWRDCADAQARLNLRCSHRR